MTSNDQDASPPPKRRKLGRFLIGGTRASTDRHTAPSQAAQSRGVGLHKEISPPTSRRGTPTSRRRFPRPHIQQQDEDGTGSDGSTTEEEEDTTQSPVPITLPLRQEGSPTLSGYTTEDEVEDEDEKAGEDKEQQPLDDAGLRILPSPIQLTRIRDLSPAENVDTVGLRDILGDPMIKECWNFNFLFNVDFVMQHFDPDVRDLVKLNIVHGFWKAEDDRRIALEQAAETYPNVKLYRAYIPDPFGTHHSKMLILLRHDDHAQVVIHTANMISRDWSNMTQAVWSSPLLPLLKDESRSVREETGNQTHPIGSGQRFKSDLLRYLAAYEKKLMGLIIQLKLYDFSSIRAAFIGSTPSRQKADVVRRGQTAFGWLGLQDILSTIPSNQQSGLPPHIVLQVSSIATLGATTTWLSHFQSILSTTASPQPFMSTSSSAKGNSSFIKASAFFDKQPASSSSSQTKPADAKFSIIFPIPSEIRSSLDGYESGASIHTKLQSKQQQSQLSYLRPILCHWQHPSPSSNTTTSPSPSTIGIRKALRGPAAPHIKTYIRFRDEEKREIDWTMLTSANLSKQAWGDVVNKKGEIWIQSWETGVVVWPGLFAHEQGKGKVSMVPTFGQDVPDEGVRDEEGGETVVGFRMPYDLPLVPYGGDEVPWCATARHTEPDWKGRIWEGY